MSRKLINRQRRHRDYVPPPAPPVHVTPAAPSIPVKSNYCYAKSERSDLSAKIIETPNWFSQGALEVCDVSIIIPLFRSAQEICKQIESWDAAIYDNISKEIIYVDDCCPDNSSNWVIKSWQSFRGRWDSMKSVCGDYTNHIGKIVKTNENIGFAAACNAGASFARGKYLIFLHADAIVTTGWIPPILEVLQANQDCGIIGNLQIHEDGTIKSAGKQWQWDSICFEDIGRDVFNGRRLDRVIDLREILPGIEEREAVSSCCMSVPKEIFDKVGGFDSNYRFSYWEDVDLCMKVKESGYKIYFQPQSIVYHSGFHSESNLHPFMSDNYNIFKNKWVENGKINNFVSKRKYEI